MEFISGAVTTQCSSRAHVNQDKFGGIVIRKPEGKNIEVALVCDGVSRSFRSEYASYNTVLYVLQWADAYFRCNDLDSNDCIYHLDAVLKRCNRRLDRFSEENSEQDYSCCTVSGLITDGDQIVVFHAGDSRIYEVDISENKLYMLTQDNIAEDGHSISMCIGAYDDTELKISYTTERFNRNGVYILCTDGMYRRTNFKKWGKYLFSAANRRMLEDQLQQMVKEVQDAGESDDVTALVLITKD